MLRGHEFNAKAGKGRGSYMNEQSDDALDWSDDEAAALGKAGEDEINLVPGDDNGARDIFRAPNPLFGTPRGGL